MTTETKTGAARSRLSISARALQHALQAGILAGLAATASAVNVTTSMNDNNRSGLNASETILTPANVNQTTFGKLFSQTVDGDMYSQPLYVQGVSIGGGTHNVVYVSTMNNTLYAFDADNGGVGAYWTNHLATAVPQGDVQCCCTDVSSVIGVNSTGVIDASTNTWYVVDKQKNADATYHLYLHAINIATGAEKFSGPKEITGSFGGVTLNAKLNNQRTGLLLQGGNVYFGCASHNDCGDYHGFVFGYNASTLAQVGVWGSTTNSGSRGGVWMAGSGLVGDGASIFFTTGNGNFNGNTGGTDMGMSAIRLNGTLALQDYFTPYNWSSLSGADLDLGGGGIMLIPGTSRLVGGGKPGQWHLINSTAMGGFNASANACIQTFMVTNPSQALNHLHHGPAYFNGTLYIGGESDYLKAYQWNGTTINTTPTSQTSFTDVLSSMPGWQQCVSANGTTNGIVWATRPNSGNANNATQPGIMHAFLASNLATELWNSKQNATRDDFGNFAKNPAPTVANGKVYCPTFSNKLCVYGILPTGSGGALSGAVAAGSTSNYNLTSLGTTDWAHWNGTYIHKASGGGKISNITQVGGGNYGTYNSTSRNISWSDGTPTGSATDDQNYVWCNNVANAGWTFTVPADTTARTLNVLFGGASGAVVKISAHLSDSSAPDYSFTQTISTATLSLGTFTYHAGAASQTMTITLLKVSDSGAASVDLDSAWLTTSTVTGALAGSVAAGSTSTYNLTSLGTRDWAHWNGTYIHKSSGGGQISNVTQIGGGNYGTWSEAQRNVSWTDGTPTGSNTDDQAYIWCNNVANAGWTFTVSADTTARTLTVLFGGATGAVVTIKAHLSDGSAADYTNTQTITSATPDLGTFTYNAASAGQTLTITLLKVSDSGAPSADLDAAWLQ